MFALLIKADSAASYCPEGQESRGWQVFRADTATAILYMQKFREFLQRLRDNWQRCRRIRRRLKNGLG